MVGGLMHLSLTQGGNELLPPVVSSIQISASSNASRAISVQVSTGAV
jgi:hypothetical protein